MGQMVRITVRWALLALVAMLAFTACSGVRDAEEWGAEAEDLFAAWAAAWSSGDPFATAAFYTPDVTVRAAHPDLELTNPASYWDTTTGGEGRSWLVDFLTGKTRQRQRSVDAVFVDADGAGVLLTIAELDTAAWFRMTMTEGAIADQVTLRWRDARKPGGTPDGRLAWVDVLIADYLAAWEAPEPGAIAALYRVDASVTADPRPAVSGRAAIAASGDILRLQAPTIATVEAGSLAGPAVFVFPGATTEELAFVVEEDRTGCAVRTAVLVTLEGTAIVDETRLIEPMSVRRCGVVAGDAGWWAGVTLPAAIAEHQTGVVAAPSGDITVYNGSDDLEDLVLWGLGRFGTAGLSPPSVESVTFGPVPACVGAAGVVVEVDGGPPDLVHCADAHTACEPSAAVCDRFDVSARFGLLHELAHVWLLEHIGGEAQERYVELVGADAWRDAAVAWHLRGVEHAAEIMAWGLMDELVDLARIGDPSCAASSAAFSQLTDRSPARTCS